MNFSRRWTHIRNKTTQSVHRGKGEIYPNDPTNVCETDHRTGNRETNTGDAKNAPTNHRNLPKNGHTRQDTKQQKWKRGKSQTTPRPTCLPRNNQEPFASKSNTSKGKGKGGKSHQSSPQSGKRKPRTRLVLRGLVSRGWGERRMQLNQWKPKAKSSWRKHTYFVK